MECNYCLADDIREKISDYVDEVFFDDKADVYDYKTILRKYFLIGPYLTSRITTSFLTSDTYDRSNPYCKFMLLYSDLYKMLMQRRSFYDTRIYLQKELTRGRYFDVGYTSYYCEYASGLEYYKLDIRQILDILREVQLEMRCKASEPIPDIEYIQKRMRRSINDCRTGVNHFLWLDINNAKDSYESYNKLINKIYSPNDDQLFKEEMRDKIFDVLYNIFWRHHFALFSYYNPISTNDNEKFMARLFTINEYSNITTLYEILIFMLIEGETIRNDRGFDLMVQELYTKKDNTKQATESLFKACEASAMIACSPIVEYSSVIKSPELSLPFKELFDNGILRYPDGKTSIEKLKEKYFIS